MNSGLYGKSYRIPQHIIEKIRSCLMAMGGNDNMGVRRAKFIVNNGTCTYQMMKRLKNFFDHLNPSTQAKEFELAGGNDMKTFIDRTLNSERSLISTRKKSNVMFMPQVSSRTLTPDSGKVDLSVNEGFNAMDISGGIEPNLGITPDLEINGLSVIFSRGNGEEKVLLLKRSSTDTWQPNKYALVGGKVEAGETPEQGTIREIKEETGLDITDFIGEFIIRTANDHVEHVFIAVIEGEPEIVINKEHCGYGWFRTDQIMTLDKTPYLDDFIALAKQKLIVWMVDNDSLIS